MSRFTRLAVAVAAAVLLSVLPVPPASADDGRSPSVPDPLDKVVDLFEAVVEHCQRVADSYAHMVAVLALVDEESLRERDLRKLLRNEVAYLRRVVREAEEAAVVARKAADRVEDEEIAKPLEGLLELTDALVVEAKARVRDLKRSIKRRKHRNATRRKGEQPFRKREAGPPPGPAVTEGPASQPPGTSPHGSSGDTQAEPAVPADGVRPEPRPAVSERVNGAAHHWVEPGEPAPTGAAAGGNGVDPAEPPPARAEGNGHGTDPAEPPVTGLEAGEDGARRQAGEDVEAGAAAMTASDAEPGILGQPDGRDAGGATVHERAPARLAGLEVACDGVPGAALCAPGAGVPEPRVFQPPSAPVDQCAGCAGRQPAPELDGVASWAVPAVPPPAGSSGVPVVAVDPAGATPSLVDGLLGLAEPVTPGPIAPGPVEPQPLAPGPSPHPWSSPSRQLVG